jgi:hypothetical protein
MTEQDLDVMERICSEDVHRDMLLEVLRYARLGLWAEIHAIPFLRQSAERDAYGFRAEEALAALPKEKP